MGEQFSRMQPMHTRVDTLELKVRAITSRLSSLEDEVVDQSMASAVKEVPAESPFHLIKREINKAADLPASTVTKIADNILAALTIGE